jgi:hypothetical protein
MKMKKIQNIWLYMLILSIVFTITVEAEIQKVKLGKEIHVLVEGDILIKEELYQKKVTHGVWTTNRWPNGIVPYQFHSNVSAARQNAMLRAMAEWENIANINFIPHTNQENYVEIDTSAGNWASVGMQEGRQWIGIFNWGNKWVMCHELAHCLGVWHEQSRRDRDFYVQINEENIDKGGLHNFWINEKALVYPKREYGLADDQTYDFDSVMHYDQFEFSSNGLPTITVLPPNDIKWQSKIGLLGHISRLDSLTMSFLYPEPGWFFVDAHGATGIMGPGTFLSPMGGFFPLITVSMPDRAVVWIQPGTYRSEGVYSKSMTIKAPLGNVVLGPNNKNAN